MRWSLLVKSKNQDTARLMGYDTDRFRAVLWKSSQSTLGNIPLMTFLLFSVFTYRDEQ